MRDATAPQHGDSLKIVEVGQFFEVFVPLRAITGGPQIAYSKMTRRKEVLAVQGGDSLISNVIKTISYSVWLTNAVILDHNQVIV